MGGRRGGHRRYRFQAGERMKLVVTGARGFLGRAFVTHLESAGVPVVALGRAEVELTDAVSVRGALADLRPTIVVHLAGSLARGNGPEVERAQWKDTFLAGKNVVETCAALGAQRVVIAGSVDELGDQGGALTPEALAKPRSPYGLCKSLLREVAAFHARRGALRVDWFRPFTVYGPGQQGPMLIAAAFEAARTGLPAEFTDGQQLRDFLYVDDLVDWLVALLQPDREAMPSGIHVHHVGTGIGTPVVDVLRAISAEFPGAQFRIGALPRRPQEPKIQVASLHPGPWRPRVSLREGLRRTAAWWRQRELP
jgi:nucleoside-diphosphate-sugar epimerase